MYYTLTSSLELSPKADGLASVLVEVFLAAGFISPYTFPFFRKKLDIAFAPGALALELLRFY